MRYVFLVIFLPFFCCSQVVTGIVRDKSTNEPLPFCSIHIKGTAKASISNEDGVFRIEIQKQTDTLVFSYLGYKTRQIKLTDFLNKNTVYLESKENKLNEIIVSGKDEFLYQLMEKARIKLLDAPEIKSKAYLEVETDKNDIPANMLESYYTATASSRGLTKLDLKAGRIALSPSSDGGYFYSDGPAQLISMISFTQKNEYVPVVPFQLNKTKLKKAFSLDMVKENEDTYQISFFPKSKNEDFFSGEVWIDKKSGSAIKIRMQADSCLRFPFKPTFPEGMISNFSIQVTGTFVVEKNSSALLLLQCEYAHDYSNNQPVTREYNGVDTVYKVRSNCMMYFYDKDKPFILPCFNFFPGISDYRKINFLPYNEVFWSNNEELLLTEKQNEKLVFFQKNGLFLQYNNKVRPRTVEVGKLVKYGFFENHYIYWSSKDRLSIKANITDTATPINKDAVAIRANLYQLNAQIFLDVNRVGDSIHHISATVFDVYNTYYRLPTDKYTDCFINIYFDIFEIERKKLEVNLHAAGNDLQKIDLFYKKSVSDAAQKASLYLKEVQTAKNFSKLKKWNNYVLDNLGLDNFEIFGVYNNQK